MPSKSERLVILGKLEQGEISPEEAARLISQESIPVRREQTAMGILDEVAGGRPTDNQSDERPRKVEIVEDKAFVPVRTWGWWETAIFLGIVLIASSGYVMNRDLADGQLGLAFLCAWAPLALGLLVVALGWAARKGPWLHFRSISHKPERRANLDIRLPVPLGVVRAFVQGFGVSIAGFDQGGLDKLQESLAEARRKGSLCTFGRRATMVATRWIST